MERIWKGSWENVRKPVFWSLFLSPQVLYLCYQGWKGKIEFFTNSSLRWHGQKTPYSTPLCCHKHDILPFLLTFAFSNNICWGKWDFFPSIYILTEHCLCARGCGRRLLSNKDVKFAPLTMLVMPSGLHQHHYQFVAIQWWGWFCKILGWFEFQRRLIQWLSGFLDDRIFLFFKDKLHHKAVFPHGVNTAAAFQASSPHSTPSRRKYFSFQAF